MALISQWESDNSQHACLLSAHHTSPQVLQAHTILVRESIVIVWPQGGTPLNNQQSSIVAEQTFWLRSASLPTELSILHIHPLPKSLKDPPNTPTNPAPPFKNKKQNHSTPQTLRHDEDRPRKSKTVIWWFNIGRETNVLFIYLTNLMV